MLIPNDYFIKLIIDIVLPVALIFLLETGKLCSKISFIFEILISFNYILFVILTGDWHIFSFYMRFVLIIGFFIGLTKSFIIHRDKIFQRNSANFFENIICLLIAGFLFYLNYSVISCFNYEKKGIVLAFPFKNGIYSVYNGGNGKHVSWMNYHYNYKSFKNAQINRSMQYAVDITKLSSTGTESRFPFSRKLNDYPIFNEKVYSPCDGKVVEITNTFDNEVPYEKNNNFSTGNTVIIETEGVYVLLGHLQKNSIKVNVGDIVKQGQFIARIGNSGSTSSPHLHIQAAISREWGGEGIPIIFDGKDTIKNTLFIKHIKQ